MIRETKYDKYFEIPNYITHYEIIKTSCISNVLYDLIATISQSNHDNYEAGKKYSSYRLKLELIDEENKQ